MGSGRRTGLTGFGVDLVLYVEIYASDKDVGEDVDASYAPEEVGVVHGEFLGGLGHEEHDY